MEIPQELVMASVYFDLPLYNMNFTTRHENCNNYYTPSKLLKRGYYWLYHDVRCVHESSKSVNTEKMVISFNILFPSNDNIPLLCRQNAIVVPVRGKLTTVIFYV